jgi:hypothetical protein
MEMEDEIQSEDAMVPESELPTPNDKVDPRNRFREYLEAQIKRRRRMESPEYQGSMADAQEGLYKAKDNAALSDLLMNSAAKFGMAGGRQVQADQGFGQAQARNIDSYMQDQTRMRGEREAGMGRDAQLYKYLADQRAQQEKLDLDRQKLQIPDYGNPIIDPISGKIQAINRRSGKLEDIGKQSPRPIEPKTPPAPKISDTAKKSSGFALSAKKAHDQFEELLKSNPQYDPSNYSDYAAGSVESVPLVGRALSSSIRSDQGKIQQQLEREFVTSAVRPESGASISEVEYAREAEKYFPRPGDTSQVRAQKKAAREQKIQNLLAEGGGFDGVAPVSVTDGIPGPRSSGEAIGSESATKIIGGKTYKKVSGGWEEVD